MGKFSDYIYNLNQQTEILKDNLTKVSGTNCSNMSIGNCAQIVNNFALDDWEATGYERPDWYPNIKNILMHATSIIIDGTEYFPVEIMLYNNSKITTDTYTSSSNYLSGKAYAFSDDYINNGSKLDESILNIGKTSHTWDIQKDILSPDKQQGVRWILIYNTEMEGGSDRLLGNTECLEIYLGKVNPGSNFLWNGNTGSGVQYFQNTIKYVDLSEMNKLSPSGMFQNLMKRYAALEEVVLPIKANITDSNAGNSFEDCYSLKKVVLNGTSFNGGSYMFANSRIKHFTINSYIGSRPFINSSLEVLNIDYSTTPSYLCQNAKALHTVIFTNTVTTIGSYFCNGCTNLNTLVIPNTVTTIGSYFCNDCYGLTSLILPNSISVIEDYFLTNVRIAYIKIPSSVSSLKMSSSSLNLCQYVELWENFNISGCNFTGAINKGISWLKHLPLWLNDLTGQEAKTLIIGSSNLSNAENIWLTFNKENKRDITWVKAGTEDAINIVQFITQQLNWTLS